MASSATVQGWAGLLWSSRRARPTLVLGGSGKTGRRIVQRLQAKGVPVRVGTPSATPPFDWTDQTTWPAALDGVGSVYVTYYPDVAIPGAAAVGAFAELAAASGARRLVLLSGRGEDGALASEQALRAAVADWTIVRPARDFTDFARDAAATGIWDGR